MGAVVVLYQGYLMCVRVHILHNVGHHLCTGLCLVVILDQHLPDPSQRLGHHGDRGHPFPGVLIVLVLDPFAVGKALADLADQLLGRLIKVDHRVGRVVGTLVDVQNGLHAAHKLGAGLRDHPRLDLPGLELVFFKMPRTLSWLIRSAYPSSTILPASRRSVHLLRPPGGRLQRRASSLASTRPSSSFSRAGSRFLPCRTVSKPSSTNLSRSRSTVLRFTR